MAKKNLFYLFVGLCSILWILFYFKNLLLVPFHPDEATQIYMSQDVELIINHTSDLFFHEIPQNQSTQLYRLLDAPLTKYFIGIFRNIFNQEPLNFDWDWTRTWNENFHAIPSDGLLYSSRLSAAIFFPFSILLFALIMKDIFGDDRFFIILSILLFSLNSLLLLHTRRAMAESGMIFFLLLSLFTFLKIPKKWFFLASIPVALAINTKQTLFFLIPLAIIIIIFYFKKHWKTLGLQLGLFFIILVGIFYVLNPIMWKEPIKVALQMMKARKELTQNQTIAIGSVTPEFLINKHSEKITAFIAQIFILDPAPQDINNYQNEINPSISRYFQNPLHKGFLRNLLGGTIYFILFIFGFYQSFYFLDRKHKLIFLSGFILLSLEILFLFKIPFQRYYLPAIPFTIIFAMIGLKQSILNLKNSHLFDSYKKLKN